LRALLPARVPMVPGREVILGGGDLVE
jgi:hypothetical protein